MSNKTHKWRSTENLTIIPLDFNKKGKISKSTQHVNYGIKLNFERSNYFIDTQRPVEAIFNGGPKTKPVLKKVSIPNNEMSEVQRLLDKTGAIIPLKPFLQKYSTNNGASPKKLYSPSPVKSSGPVRTQAGYVLNPSQPLSSPILPTNSYEQNTQTSKILTSNLLKSNPPSITSKSLTLTSVRQNGPNAADGSVLGRSNTSYKITGSFLNFENPLNVNLKNKFSFEKIHDNEYIEITSLIESEAVSLMKYLCIVVKSVAGHNDEILLALEEFKNNMVDDVWGTFRLLIVTDGFSIKNDILADEFHVNIVKERRRQSMLISSDEKEGEEYMPINMKVLDMSCEFESMDEDEEDVPEEDVPEDQTEPGNPEFEWPEKTEDDEDDEMDEDEAGIIMAKTMAQKFRDSRVINVNKSVTKTTEINDGRSKLTHALHNFAKKLENNIGVAHHTSIDIAKFVETIHDCVYEMTEKA